MRGWRVRGAPLVLAWLSAAFIIMLNGALLWQLTIRS
jgi:manganese transport protein